jgi:selenocysteine lyase/cysteine desulfurase
MVKHPIYLDNAATSWPKPPSVAAAMADFLTHHAGNPGRGGHRLAREAAAVIETARDQIAHLINATERERVILTHGCTDSVNMAIHGIIEPLRRCNGVDRKGSRPHVVSSAVEHNAVTRSLHLYASDGIIDLTIVGCDAVGRTDPEEMLGACNERTVLVCLSHASNACGTLQPVRTIGHALRERFPEAVFLVDAAQTVGHLPVDVQADAIDLLSVAGHKGLRGPTGTGALFVGERAHSTDYGDPRAKHLYCSRAGGTGAVAPGQGMPTQMPDALEAGTTNAVGWAGFVAAMESPHDHGVEYELDLTMAAMEGLEEIPGVTIYGLKQREERTPVLLFTLEGHLPREIGGWLDAEHDIAVRGGTHCAPLLHEAIGTGEQGAGRLSPGPTTTMEEIGKLVEAVKVLAGIGVGA